MSYNVDDTIAAIASAPGGALRGIVRVSGPDVVSCLKQAFHPEQSFNWNELRHSVVVSGELQLNEPLGTVPCDVYLWPTVRSYTRQPCAEIHTIGSPPVLDAIVRRICHEGARLAQPGEFTMRAFLAGRIDLTQAEAVLGVIDAADRAELEVALSQLSGGLRGPLNQLRDSLLDLLAHLEAGLDFVEEDIQFISNEELQRALENGIDQIQQLVEQMEQRSEAMDDFRIAVIGSPNVGKSSLVNSLAGESVAMVSNAAGTTRDYVTRRITLNGVSCLLADTAGMATESADQIDAKAQTKSAAQSQSAHLQLFCIDASRPLNEWECIQLATPTETARIHVLTKSDLPTTSDFDGETISTSSKTGDGLEELREKITQNFDTNTHAAVVGGTAVRCRDSLRLASDCLLRAKQLVKNSLGEELIAAEIRLGLEELGKVVGAIYTDDVLDRVFSRFCIGK